MPTNGQQRIFKQAVAWFVELQSECCDEQRRNQFQDWLNANEAHRRAYAEAENLWANFDHLKKMERPASYDAGNTRARVGGATRQGLAAILFAAVLTGWWLDYSAETVRYMTGVGERQSVDLADGSRLELNAVSRLSVKLSWLRRRVELEEGEALFTVAHQALRPFTVQTDQYSIKDIGTRFNVKKRPEGGSVSVLEGEVELRRGQSWFGDRLKAGFSRSIDQYGRLQQAEAADPEQSTAWTNGRLIFEHRPLAEITAELERHHTVRFVFADPSLAKLTLSGSFDSTDLKPFLQAVEAMLPIHAARQKQTVVLSKR